MAGRAEDLLRRLAAHEDGALRGVLSLQTGRESGVDNLGAALTPRTKMLVRLAALFAVDASTTTLRWAVERAECAGADDEEIVGVLVTVGPALGLSRIASIAPRLALAIGCDIGND